MQGEEIVEELEKYIHWPIEMLWQEFLFLESTALYGMIHPESKESKKIYSSERELKRVDTVIDLRPASEKQYLVNLLLDDIRWANDENKLSRLIFEKSYFEYKFMRKKKKPTFDE